MTRTVLVTGAAGFTGHHVVAGATKAGQRVRATDLSSRFYGPWYEALGAEFVASDLVSGKGLDRLLDGVDLVLHVAGIHDYSTPEPILRAVNVKAVDNLCRAAAASKKSPRFVHLSSVAVYGYDWHGSTPVAEDAPKLTPPDNPYNTTKWEGEQVVSRYVAEQKLAATILRPAAIYGSRAEYGLYNLFARVHMDRNRSRALMIGSGKHLEAFVHVSDVCRAMLHVAEKPETIGEAYNIADDSRMTTEDLFRLVSRELLGHEKPFLHVPPRLMLRVADVAQLAARTFGTRPLLERATLEYLSFDRVWSNAKLKATGFRFDYPTCEQGLKETLTWYKENGWLRN